jgi:hypothetical protein
MSRKQPRAMTAKQFAEAMDVNYRTALNWLEAGLVPGAERRVSPIGEYWEIPEAALSMQRPRPGPKPKAKTETQPAKKRGRKAA